MQYIQMTKSFQWWNLYKTIWSSLCQFSTKYISIWDFNWKVLEHFTGADHIIQEIMVGNKIFVNLFVIYMGVMWISLAWTNSSIINFHTSCAMRNHYIRTFCFIFYQYTSLITNIVCAVFSISFLHISIYAPERIKFDCHAALSQRRSQYFSF